MWPIQLHSDLAFAHIKTYADTDRKLIPREETSITLPYFNIPHILLLYIFEVNHKEQARGSLWFVTEHKSDRLGLHEYSKIAFDVSMTGERIHSADFTCG